MNRDWIQVESGCQIITLSRDCLTIRLKPDVVERLKESIKDDHMLNQALLTLLTWAHYSTIPIMDVLDVVIETIPSPPGSPELMKLIIKSNFQGGQRLYEVYLNPADAQKLASEVKKIISSKF
ncbi:MAG: hypothetical protein HXX80_04610 [Nitrososphaerales archaeon]|nr:hypothetical protein [Nitrososphaerales archaeon]